MAVDDAVADEVQLKDVDTDAVADVVAVRVRVAVREPVGETEGVEDALAELVAVLLSDGCPTAIPMHMHSNASNKGIAKASRARREHDPIAVICSWRGVGAEKLVVTGTIPSASSFRTYV